MKHTSIMQSAMGEQWHQLPPPLQAHYQAAANVDVGELTIEYPLFMRPYLFILKLLGALINRAGTSKHAVVSKHMSGTRQHWRREIQFSDHEVVRFNSVWEYAGDRQLIEYVNPVCGLRMSVHVNDGQLQYEGIHIVLKLGPLKIPLPEWLLGHTTITETAHDDGSFSMDFRLRHPWFGQLYRYSGRFKTEPVNQEAESSVISSPNH